jgi:hypothetical protein
VLCELTIHVTGHRSDLVIGLVEESVVGEKKVNVVGPSVETVTGPHAVSLAEGHMLPSNESAVAIQALFLTGARGAAHDDFGAAVLAYRRARDLYRGEAHGGALSPASWGRGGGFGMAIEAGNAAAAPARHASTFAEAVTMLAELLDKLGLGPQAAHLRGLLEAPICAGAGARRC